MSNDKWIMFKNYMHNELGITKSDIRTWIEDAVKEQAERMVQNEFRSFDVEKIIRKIIMDDRYFSSPKLKGEITQEVANQLMKHIKIS